MSNVEFFSRNRLRSCENAIGIMTKLQTSLVAEETWVDGAAEKLASLPTATSAYELDVSICICNLKQHHIDILLSFTIKFFFLLSSKTQTFFFSF